MGKLFTSRDFNQATAAAKRAARDGPVVITDRGEPAFVLMTIEEYRRLAQPPKSVAEALGMEEAADVEFEPARLTDISRPAEFD